MDRQTYMARTILHYYYSYYDHCDNWVVIRNVVSDDAIVIPTVVHLHCYEYHRHHRNRRRSHSRPMGHGLNGYGTFDNVSIPILPCKHVRHVSVPAVDVAVVPYGLYHPIIFVISTNQCCSLRWVLTILVQSHSLLLHNHVTFDMLSPIDNTL